MLMQVTVVLQAQCMFQSDHVCVLFCQIPSDLYNNELAPAECQEIDTMCISPAEETLAISTDRGQLYSFSLSSVDMNKVHLYIAALTKNTASFVRPQHSGVPVHRALT